MQSGGGLGIAGGKQRDVMTAAHELFGDVRNNALRATIKLRRYTFVQGRRIWRMRRRGIAEYVRGLCSVASDYSNAVAPDSPSRVSSTLRSVRGAHRLARELRIVVLANAGWFSQTTGFPSSR